MGMSWFAEKELVMAGWLNVWFGVTEIKRFKVVFCYYSKLIAKCTKCESENFTPVKFVELNFSITKILHTFGIQVYTRLQSFILLFLNLMQFCYIMRAHLSPISVMPTFTETSLQEKSWTQIMKVADTNHLDMSRCLRQSPWQVRNKPVCVALMEFGPLQCMGKVGDKVHDKVRNKFATKSRTCRRHKSWKSATWFVFRTFMICHDFVANLFRTLSQSQHNGIWALENFPF